MVKLIYGVLSLQFFVTKTLREVVNIPASAIPTQNGNIVVYEPHMNIRKKKRYSRTVIIEISNLLTLCSNSLWHSVFHFIQIYHDFSVFASSFFSVTSTFIGRAIGIIFNASVQAINVSTVAPLQFADGIARWADNLENRLEKWTVEIFWADAYGQWHTDSGQFGGYRRQFVWHQVDMPGKIRKLLVGIQTWSLQV